MQKSLDLKLKNIRENPSSSKDFILADAKDADMAFGLVSPGKAAGEGERLRSLAEFRNQMREIVRQGLVDIMLMSASSSELLALQERLFDDSPVTPAVRANDTTDIHVIRGGCYNRSPSRPFRTVTIEQIQSGKVACTQAERQRGPDLGLYSVTFNNELDSDHRTLEAYREFRIEAEHKGMRHFLEVFDPVVPGAVEPEQLGNFINDHIARLLAGVPQAGRPIFLKIAYHGPKAMEELVHYDPGLVPGILGGSSGTTHDAFKLLADAKKYGARAALFGRKINTAEHQLAFVRFLRALADGEMTPQEAVKAYHGELQKLGLRPQRPLEEDLRITQPFL
ncbi:MAG: hypothetical protein U0V70_19170 [Terriglobia bacterium]